jgi:hypothetical protein
MASLGQAEVRTKKIEQDTEMMQSVEENNCGRRIQGVSR